jgi:hypothetical protein
LSAKYSETKIHQFIKAFVDSKEGQIVDQSDEVFTIKYPNVTSPKEYTYQPILAREKKIPLITTGSPAFQQIIKECLENGVLCQVAIKPKTKIETLLKKFYRDSPSTCEDCDKIPTGKKVVEACAKSPQCYHKINNAKIVSMKVIKKERARYFRFYFSAIFQNKLRPKNEETIIILMDENGSNIPNSGNFSQEDILKNKAFEFNDFEEKLEAQVFDKLKTIADEQLNNILKEKLILFDLSLSKEIKSKLRSFDKRLRGERREKAISRKHDFDEQQWQTNYEALLKREEESFITHINVKFINLLVVNTTRIKFEVKLDNNSTIQSSFVLGISNPEDITCSECGQNFHEGYATQDSNYLCLNCVKQSADTGKIYSTKQELTLDATLNEYIETDSGFICSVCNQKHSRLLEFQCTHDRSSICVYHYDLCAVCGNVFSELNLSESKESRRKLCPDHSTKCKTCGSTISVDEGSICKASGNRFCTGCKTLTKCSSCQQEYSSNSIIGEKCPACSNLNEPKDQSTILAVQEFDNTQRKTNKWLLGKNAMNSIVIARGVFSSTLYVVENGKVTYQKSISFFNKLRGH